MLNSQITWKVTWKSGVKPREREDFSHFSNWVLLVIKRLLETNFRNGTLNLVGPLSEKQLTQDEIKPTLIRNIYY